MSDFITFEIYLRVRFTAAVFNWKFGHLLM